MSVETDAARTPPRPLRAIVLAFEFPPLAAGGVYRALGFVRTLPSLGFDVDIVTVAESDYRVWSQAPIDHSLSERVPATVRVHRISSGFPSWYWSLTRNRAGFRLAQYGYWGDPVALFWHRPLFAYLDKLVSHRRPDVLLATAPPFGVAVLGRRAARRYRLPWVVDFRDAWSRWCVAPYPTIGHYFYARRAERDALRHANVAVATSHVTRDEWMSDTPDLDPRRLVTIYNGFDCDERADGSARDRAADSGGRVSRPTRSDPSVWQREIVYVGSFYYTPEARAASYRPFWRRRPDQWLQYRLRREDWLYRSPYFFLRGLAHFQQRRPDLADRVRVTFLGQIPTWLPAMLAATSTSDAVTLRGPVPHAEALRVVRECSVALLTSAKVEGGRDYSIAGKMYEYFAARVPILAVLTDGAMRDLVLRSGLGLFADPDDIDSVAAVLEQIAESDDPRNLVAPDEAFLSQFHRPRLAGELAGHLRRVAAEGYRG
jgi:glycosyltransferase involved in cell wall biosynthesis